MRVLSVGSLPPAWGGATYGGVATLHATLLEGFLEPDCPLEIVGVLPPSPLDRELPVPAFARPAGESGAAFYKGVLRELEPDVVIMHHFAHTIGVAHARLASAPPAIGIAHSWHNITYRSGEERRRARAVTEEALGGLRALVGMSRHCLLEGERLGLRYPAAVETIYHPLQPLYSREEVGPDVERERRGIAYLGSLIPRKNPAALVEAATRLPGLEVSLAGYGELDGSLRSSIASLSLADRVGIRHYDDRQARDLLLRSEAMCLPSRSETFGLAYIEALACGTPVIGFAPTLREIRDEVGIDIGEPLEGSGPEHVAAAIERVRAASWDRAELRRRTLEAFAVPRAIERYAELIGRVASRSQLGGARVGPAPGRAAEPQAPSRAICVLGMSRTGTSLAARLLSVAGVYLGPQEELLGGELRHLAGEGDAVIARARAANPEGFWEHYRLMRLNERILRRLGGNWRDPPPLPAGWESSEELAEEREEARSMLAESFDGHALWGWKDPRNSLTLPFWQRLVPDMRFVICLRNPVDVALSLQSRDGMALEEGVQLWLTYVAAALVNTSGRPRLLVPYESHFEDPGGTAARLARFAGRGEALDDPGVARRLADAIDGRLWRNRTAAGDVTAAEFVSPAAASMYLIVELLAAARGVEGEDRTAGELDGAVDRYARSLQGRLALAGAGVS
jgi:glycosyltransferase involved in cell wall biosynthesis